MLELIIPTLLFLGAWLLAFGSTGALIAAILAMM
jgi:hypothetical protein